MPDATTTKPGRLYWQSLSHLDDTPEVRQLIENEFAGYDPKAVASMPRRRFLKLMGASMALSGLTLTGCRRWPQERLAPYAAAVRDRIPGIPELYATSFEMGGIGQGLLATSFDGRPIKVEGNPSHPASATFGGKLGAAGRYAQATVLELYDPDRSRFVVDRSGQSPRQSSWEEFFLAFSAHVQANTPGGAGLAVLSEASESPSVLAMRAALVKALPQAKLFEYEPVSFDNEHAGVKAATGRMGRSVLQLAGARVIVSFDDDFLGSHPNLTRYGNDFARMRRIADAEAVMSRLYVADTTFSLTGANADERLPVRPSRVEALVAALAAALGVNASSAGAPRTMDAAAAEWVANAAADIQANPGAAVVSAGLACSPRVHAMVAAINAAIGAVGKTVSYVQVPDRPTHAQSIAGLAQEMRSGNVKGLLILGGNPVYDAPADCGFAEALRSIPLSAHLSFYMNETSLACSWHLPRAHYLEAWGDTRSWDGTVGTAQPLIEPIFGGKSVIELLAALAGFETTDGEQIVRQTLARLTGDSAESAWRQWIHDGVVPQSAYPVISVAAGSTGISEPPPADDNGGFEVRFIPHAGLYDGRFGNNAWLLELPDPMTKLTWDNAALISKSDADALGVGNGTMLNVKVGERAIAAPAYIQPGQPAGVIALALGFGRTAAGSVGGSAGAGVKPCGFDVYPLRTTGGLWFAPAAVGRGEGSYDLVGTADHFLIDDVGFKGREKRVGQPFSSGKVVREATFADYVGHHRDPHLFEPPGGHGPTPRLQLFAPPTNYPQRDPGAPTLFNHPHAWGMAIDMNACIGCNACVVACQAENNIPVVGKENVKVNREMHWLRIDRYFKASGASLDEKKNDPNPQVVFQPMMCVQCENAPCEQVCPVAATVHDTEGLNTMVYNRCIGTRYCSNNCPYKVRRFNYFDWHSVGPRSGRHKLPYLNWPDQQQKDSINPLHAMVFNPEVSVRMRGVMEKCTYCTQRIAAAKITARNEWKQGRRATDEVRDGEVITACQQACPTEAIVFGNLNDATSAVRKLHANARAYEVLQDLNSRPRSKHLAKLRNPVKAPSKSPAGAKDAH